MITRQSRRAYCFSEMRMRIWPYKDSRPREDIVGIPHNDVCALLAVCMRPTDHVKDVSKSRH